MGFIRQHMLLRLLPAVLILFAVSGCSCFKQGAYTMAMEIERCGTGLSPATLTVDGMEIAIFEGNGRGEKPPLVLLHGFGASKEVWLRFSRHLKDDFHIIAIDLPGHGASSKPMDREYSLCNQLTWLRGALTEMGLERPHMAGNSMGGLIVALYADRYPEDVASITLFNPGGISAHESEFMQYLARGENPLLVENTDDFMQVMDFTMERKPFLVWPITSVLAEKAILNRPIHQKIFEDSRLKECILHEKEGFRETLGAIRVPALIIWGRHDRLVHVHNALVFNELIPGSRMVIIEEAGHAPMLEVPQISADRLREFIIKAPSRI